MGKKGKNDRGIYDDAIFVCGPNIFKGFRANVDPSIFRKGIATLAPGVHWYHRGKHGITRPGGGYPAFRPATKDEELPVMRDGQPGMSQGVAINIHKGGYGSTSSEGCQTIYPDEWAAFYALVDESLRAKNQVRFPYILVLNTPDSVLQKPTTS